MSDFACLPFDFCEHEKLLGGVILDDVMRIKDRDAVRIWLMILDFMNVFKNYKI